MEVLEFIFTFDLFGQDRLLRGISLLIGVFFWAGCMSILEQHKKNKHDIFLAECRDVVREVGRHWKALKQYSYVTKGHEAQEFIRAYNYISNEVNIILWKRFEEWKNESN